MKLSKIPPSVLIACRSRGFKDKEIENMAPRDLFHEFCEWEGLISWNETLWNVVSTLMKG